MTRHPNAATQNLPLHISIYAVKKGELDVALATLLMLSEP